MDETQRRVDEIRHRSSEMENHLIDTYRKGGIDRREFVRRGTVLGMSAGAIGFLASACGSGDEGGGGTTTSSDQQAQSVQKGGKVTAAINSPAGAIDPITVADDGGLAVLGQAGEYLVWSDSELNAVPRLAESWTPNEDASVWTFKIRQGVKFHDGKEMTAEDVAASINRLADPESASQALSAFTGFLTKDSAKATDATTVEFSLEAPNGSFPYLLSSDNYNTIILPADYDGDYEKNMNGTGPFILEKFTQGQGATFRKNPDYWDKERQPNPDNTEIRFYGKEQARVLAPAVGRGRRRHAVLRLRRPRAADRPERADRRAEGLDAPPGAPAHGQGAVHRQARPPGARARDRPQRARRRPVQGQGPARQRLAVRAGVQVHGHVRRAAPAGHRAGQAAARRRRHARRLRGAAGHLGRLRDPRPGAADPEQRQGDRRDDQAEHHGRRAPTTATPSTASRPGSTPTWASRTTATAASSTCSSARRCCPTAPGTARTSATRSTTSWSRTSSPSPTSTSRSSARSRSRSCSWTRRRSSSRTSTTSSRASGRASRASRRRAWGTSS